MSNLIAFHLYSYHSLKKNFNLIIYQGVNYILSILFLKIIFIDIVQSHNIISSINPFIIHIFYFPVISFICYLNTHTSKIQINRREGNLMFTKVSKYRKYDQLYGRLLPIGCNKRVQLVVELKHCSRGSWHVSKLSRKFVTG